MWKCQSSFMSDHLQWAISKSTSYALDCFRIPGCLVTGCWNTSLANLVTMVDILDGLVSSLTWWSIAQLILVHFAKQKDTLVLSSASIEIHIPLVLLDDFLEIECSHGNSILSIFEMKFTAEALHARKSWLLSKYIKWWLKLALRFKVIVHDLFLFCSHFYVNFFDLFDFLL